VPVAEDAGAAVHIDEGGFLLDGTQWTPDNAEAIAAEVGIALVARVAGLPACAGLQDRH